MWTLLFSAFIVGCIGSLPTGPLGAYIVSRRIEQGRIIMISAILSAIFTDLCYITLILHKGAGISRYIQQFPVIITVISLVIIGIGIERLLYTAKDNLKITGHVVENSAQVFITGSVINFTNPSIIIAILSLLQNFNLFPITEQSFTPTLIGYAIGCVAMWTLIGFILEKSIQSKKSINIVTKLCGIVMIIAGILSISRAWL